MKIKKTTRLKNISINSNLFFYNVSSKNQSTKKQLRSFWKYIFLFLTIVLIITFFAFLDYSFADKFGFKLFAKNLKKLFSFDSESTYLLGKTNNWSLSFKYLFITIKTTLSGTFIGFLLALLTSFFSSKYSVNKYFSIIVKSIILFLRSIPELVFINLFMIGFYPEMAMVMVFMWFSWLWLHKYFIDAIDSFNIKDYYDSIKQGDIKIISFYNHIFKRLFSRFASLFIYSFESNIRWGSIISILGLSGIGILINFSGSSDQYFSQISIPLLILFIFIIMLEILNFILKKYLFDDVSKINKETDFKKLVSKKDVKKILKITLFIILIISSIVVVSTINISRTSIQQTKDFFKSVFNVDWSVIKLNNSLDYNPFLQIYQALKFSLYSLIIMIIFSFYILYMSLYKLKGIRTSFIFKFINTLIRVIPSVMLIYIFNPILNSKITLLIFVLSLHSSSSFTKRLYETIDTLDFAFIENLKIQNISNFKIYKSYLIPSIKKELILLLVLYFELGFRNAITYSAFSSGELRIGSFINQNMNQIKYQPNRAMAYIWISSISIIVINLFSEIYKNYDFIKKKTTTIYNKIKTCS
ncbi:ABC transporter permease subunit [Mycoplasma crocodyli]|uniref:ABC transporter permease subunit n=1 Tax=Mycoplasma crocodyli TaxID=50052 RepID=UPI000312806C|nr:ABC transporter permease subunit [Mycoplasma crocodyli]